MRMSYGVELCITVTELEMVVLVDSALRRTGGTVVLML